MTKHPALRHSRPFLLILVLLAVPMWATFALTNGAASESPRKKQPKPIRLGSSYEAHFVGKPVVRIAAGGTSKVDPIQANGEIFVDWPKPDLALVFTGEQMGFLEPCGCAGLENQKGGFKRRMTMLRQLQDQGWPVVAMDTGGLVRRYGPQEQNKLAKILEGLNMMDYQAVGFGDKELKLDMLSEAANLDPNPLVSANIGLVDFDSGFTQRYRVVEKNGFRVGMTSVLGKQETAAAEVMRDLVTLPPEEAIAQVLPQLMSEKCDEMVLLVYGEVAEARALSEKFPQFRWVVAGKGGDEPPKTATPIPESGAYLIEVGHKGMYAVVVGIYRQGEPKYRYQKVPMDHRFEDAPEMQQLLVRYQDELKTLVTAAGSFKPLIGGDPLPPPGGGGGFIGSEACADCHSTACEIFMNSPHAHATETLVKLDPPRHFDPECLSCHVTGWNPQGFAPYATGYLSLEETPQLTTQGCENCHGPGKDHYDAESGNIDATEEEIEKFRAALRMEVIPNEGNKEGQDMGRVVKNCLECHDLDNSPDFDFQEYWNREEKPVKHEGKD
ncbi:multiheme c-type cytochrome [Aeoliella sp. SH292]|uniref:multiheme c-type cytochrome n=1 Tax=Aeoliella sp. SH292 TaxID=3454464 RepID=UPI003F991014